MKNQFSVFDITLLVCIVNGIVFSFLLLKSSRNKNQNKILGFLILCFVLVSGKILLHTLQLWKGFLAYIPLSLDLAIPPLVFFYTVSLLKKQFVISKKLLIHFLPMLIFQTYSLLVYFNVFFEGQLAIKDEIAQKLYYNPVKKIEDVFMGISVVYYLFLSLKTFSKSKKIDKKIEILKTSTLNWLQNFLLISIVISAILIINLILDWAQILSKDYFFHWKILYVLIAINIYYLAIKGYKIGEINHILIDKTSKKKVEKIDRNKTQKIKLLIENALQIDEVYKNPEITLSSFAKELKLDKGIVSYAINEIYNINFRELINNYRIDAVLKAIKKQKHNDFSIFGLALECGFNSESTFYRAFKKKTGKTPQQFFNS